MGTVITPDNIKLHYDEYGSGDNVIITAQIGFPPRGMHTAMAEMGYHVYCLTLRGFAPSSFVTEDYGDKWYDVFADDVAFMAESLGIGKFIYMGASHGAGVGWHLMLRHSEMVSAFIAMVPGPHSLAEGVMSYRQMMMQGIISSPPPFDPPVDNDPARQERRLQRNQWLAGLPKQDPREEKIDYGRPLSYLGSEEALCSALSKITTPTLILGGTEDPISTPQLMMRTARCLSHCKLVMYSNCGHNIDTDITEELAREADGFLKNAVSAGKWYVPLHGSEND